MKEYLNLLRPAHWAKNLLVFGLPASAGILFSNFWQSLLEILILSVSSSLNYIVNDLIDVDIDRANPAKAYRPLASGLVSEGSAKIVVLCFLVFFFLLNFYGVNAVTFKFNLLFLISQFLYSFVLKRVAVLEIITLSILYIFRSLIAYTFIEVNFSFWYFNLVLFSSMFLVLLKRYAELKAQNFKSRIVLSVYNAQFLVSWIVVCLSVIIMTFGLWMEEIFKQTGSFVVFIMTLPLLILLMRLSLTSDVILLQNSIKLVFRDWIIVFCFLTICVLYYISKGFIN